MEEKESEERANENERVCDHGERRDVKRLLEVVGGRSRAWVRVRVWVSECAVGVGTKGERSYVRLH